MIPTEHRDGVPEGWQHELERIREFALRNKSAIGQNWVLNGRERD
jgi:hypothetical protein